MTREEETQNAIEWIEGLRDRWNDKDNVKYCNMAIKALEQKEPEKCEDCISRQAARNALLNKGQHSKRYKLGETWELNLMEIEETLWELPSVEPERKTGHWIHDEDWECSVCHSHFPESKFMADDYDTPIYNYCPICGADLTGV